MEQLQGYSQQLLAASSGLNTHSGAGAHYAPRVASMLASIGHQSAGPLQSNGPNAGQGALLSRVLPSNADR